jgi:hypothetical protein
VVPSRPGHLGIILKGGGASGSILGVPSHGMRPNACCCCCAVAEALPRTRPRRPPRPAPSPGVLPLVLKPGVLIFIGWF